MRWTACLVLMGRIAVTLLSETYRFQGNNVKTSSTCGVPAELSGSPQVPLPGQRPPGLGASAPTLLPITLARGEAQRWQVGAGPLGGKPLGPMW